MRAVDRADSSGSLVPKTCPKAPSLVRLVWIRFGKLRPTSNWCLWCPDESMAPVLAIAGMVARTVQCDGPLTPVERFLNLSSPARTGS
jgi:hypothetical protein